MGEEDSWGPQTTAWGLPREQARIQRKRKSRLPTFWKEVERFSENQEVKKLRGDESRVVIMLLYGTSTKVPSRPHTHNSAGVSRN